jgi:hypothetical protein
MSTVIMRSALKPGGLCYRPDRDLGDIHSVQIAYPGAKPIIVTRTEVNAAKEQRHRDRLNYAIEEAQWHAVKLWVAYFDQDFYCGWWAFLDGLKGFHEWLKGGSDQLMKLFPLVPEMDNKRQQWQAWMPVFAKKYKRRRHHKKPVGVAYLWMRGRELQRIEERPG